MGCAPSTPAIGSKSAGGSAAAYAPSVPEISGKSKFLSCPVTGDIVHPSTGDTWFIICFAPVSPYGLVIAAKNMNRKSEPLLVKDILDAQITQEKEQQKVSMSWNVFFKALASEIPKANRGGASCNFLADGGLEIEIRISLMGAAAQAKKPDTYRCVLQPTPSTPQNLYKYYVAPIATYFGKKRTDLIEKPDTAKEKVYGELEAAYLLKQASIKRAEAVINKKAPIIEQLRSDVADAEADAIDSVAKLAVLNQMRYEKSPLPLWLQPIATEPITAHVDPLTLSLQANVTPPLRTATTIELDLIPPFPEEVPPSVISQHQMISALYAAEQDWLNVPLAVPLITQHQGSGGFGVVVAYMLQRFSNAQQRKLLSAAKIIALSQDIESVVGNVTPFFSTQRCILVAASFLFLMSKGDLHHKLALKGDLSLTAVLSACGCMLHHNGSSNSLNVEANTLLSNLYPEATLQRHSSAILLSLLRKHNVDSTLYCPSALATIIGATSEFDLPSSNAVALFKQRSKEIKDFGRARSDKIVALCAVLALCSVSHLFVASEGKFGWLDMHEKAKAKLQQLYSMYGVTRGDHLSTSWWDDSEGKVTELLECFSAVFPKIIPSVDGAPGVLVQAPSIVGTFP